MLTKRMFKMTAMAAAMTAVLCSAFISYANAAKMRDSQDIVKEMGVGWNLGNTLDAFNDTIAEGSTTDVYETC